MEDNKVTQNNLNPEGFNTRYKKFKEELDSEEFKAEYKKFLEYEDPEFLEALKPIDFDKYFKREPKPEKPKEEPKPKVGGGGCPVLSYGIFDGLL